ncbi:hypothetical protein PhCBS80983_g01501 [Powellomyces hirtus]|uniref:RRM domain-containing protein n=1 Tax=Powellomyces hirtus TaxID=109895 RepID=A0A507E9Y6_9FUNG|nr:hypothetical protein PhCBS80983_g01501 [Powellomyces hirtus]
MQQEEITTIFVVGFPDDMLEREFQNMFTFSSGFEAATLKIPSQNDSDDGTGLPNARKQIEQIGFAKFRTRLDALEARDVLSGRKVDAERGCVLKAEMAKKNLHTKRGLSNENPILVAPGFGMNPFAQLQRRGSTKEDAMFDPFFMSGPPTPSLSRELFGSQDPYSQLDICDIYSSQESITGRGTSASISESFSARGGGPSFSDFMDPMKPSMASSVPNRSYMSEAAAHFNEMMDNPGPTPPARLVRSHSVSEQRGFSSALFSSESLLPRLSPPMSMGGPVSTNATNSSTGSITSSASSSAGTSPTSLLPYNARSNADHNPPCNTLYVGNLPPDTSEEELRQLFLRCPGYKRLCFRGRPNGPMCFVEFDDVQCATQALFQLYGNPLSNSTKGGIRLSYSKNPLGVRTALPTPATTPNMMAAPFISMDKEPRAIHGC